MDEETRQAFTRAFADPTKQMIDRHDRLIAQMDSLGREFRNTKGFLIEDALLLCRRVTATESRLDDLEEKP